MKIGKALLVLSLYGFGHSSASTLIYWDGTETVGGDALKSLGTQGIDATRLSGTTPGTW